VIRDVMSLLVGILLIGGAAGTASFAIRGGRGSSVPTGRRVKPAGRRRVRPRARRAPRKREVWWLCLAAIMLVSGGIAIGRALLAVSDTAGVVEMARVAQPPATAATPTPTRDERAAAGRTSREDQRPRRSVPRIPEAGSGEFRAAGGESMPRGSGSRVTYSVEVEQGLPYSTATVAQFVDDVLSDTRGWTSVTPAELQRVSEAPMFRIRLATPETADELCKPLDTAGRLSCRNGEMVVLNAWRWANGAEAYGSDLKRYRTYLVNHEFGHALGNGHDQCPGAGEPSPVMAQQTKGLDGCRPNPWPADN